MMVSEEYFSDLRMNVFRDKVYKILMEADEHTCFLINEAVMFIKEYKQDGSVNIIWFEGRRHKK